MPLTLPHTLTAGTNENVTHVQNNFVEVANAFPVQAANIGDSQVTTAKIATGAVTPHKYLTVAHLSAASTYTLSGLSGDADYGYELQFIGMWTLPVVGADVSRVIYVRPNNDATAANYSGQIHRWTLNGTTTVFEDHIDQSTNPGMYAAWNYEIAGVEDYTVTFTCRINAKQGTDRVRSGIYESVSRRSEPGANVVSGQVRTLSRGEMGWMNITDNITSLVIVPSAGTITGMLSLRKLGAV